MPSRKLTDREVAELKKVLDKSNNTVGRPKKIVPESALLKLSSRGRKPKVTSTSTDYALASDSVTPTTPILATLRTLESRITKLGERTSGIDNGFYELKEDWKKLTKNIKETQQKQSDAIAAMAAAILARRKVSVRNERVGKVFEFEGMVHKSFEDALTVLVEDGCIWLYGPAGTFKTSTSRLLAQAIFPDREEVDRFFPQSVNRQTTKSDLMGYTTADGRYVETPLYRARKFGGAFLMDEVDAANENSLTAINAAVENDVVLFPNGELVQKHPEFYVIAAGNTVGKGGDAQFVGRNVIDGATISRFPFFYFGPDWGMTDVICKEIAGEEGSKWSSYVQMVDDIVQHLRIPHPVGPRAAVKGAKLLAGGVKWDMVEELRLFGSLKPDTVDVIRAKMVKK